ncbi:MAG: tRNA pseudouridine(38-40) synthase TruA [Spirochaetes bacterium]|nr:tRNA pseudouridine(38-40) synthase TruA [Spirochaetota bacterium]
MNGTSKLEEQKNRIALLVQYDGTKFNGLQIQNSGRTVQAELEKALYLISKENIRITASGRTDSGVHALGQIIHFDISSNITLKKICAGINGILNNDISVKNAYKVPSSFHSRYSATQREYLYLIYNHPQQSPFIVNRAMWINYGLDIEYLKKVSSYLIGENDFSSFCKKSSAEGNNNIRIINSINIENNEELISITINGTAFLHNMIRIMIGTILGMFKEKREPEYVLDILEKKDRAAGGKTAPAHGLYLNKVYYDPPLSEMESAF